VEGLAIGHIKEAAKNEIVQPGNCDKLVQSMRSATGRRGRQRTLFGRP